ncbi:type II toxin-antitoxin system RelB/DinJ family antitoxin [Enterococcus sp. 669A]|uniref:Type II toxin-antitoxin system RelB/DinJ family antitoxin n=1 Tax=Candidatus Enterococcus moelleringii TaxID=2815325 RepID=A0ABS3L8W4_9ENTE|nr:type II toxin-antitoxin system RelB/DinJ family antitoxin [Enterococcus sp. 669A]MBO1306069.1 type II toxin-antitoxin system RelB/DinJ family antitoxin [Enterococcus sp. 669A]
MAHLNMRLDDNLIKEACEVFDSLEMDLTTGIRIYLTRVIRDRGIPFDWTSPKSDFDEALMDMEHGNYKTFNSVEELMKDLNSED